LCMHGSRHSWERLGWICDIAEIVHCYSRWNWAQIMREAVGLGSERNLALGLYLANDLLGAKVPREVVDKIHADPTIRSLAHQVQELILQDTPKSLDITYLHDYHLRMKERMTDRIRLRFHYYYRYLQLAVRPTALDRSSLSRSARLSFLSYLVRPFRLIGENGAGMLARLFSRRRN